MQEIINSIFIGLPFVALGAAVTLLVANFRA